MILDCKKSLFLAGIICAGFCSFCDVFSADRFNPLSHQKFILKSDDQGDLIQEEIVFTPLKKEVEATAFCEETTKSFLVEAKDCKVPVLFSDNGSDQVVVIGQGFPGKKEWYKWRRDFLKNMTLFCLTIDGVICLDFYFGRPRFFIRSIHFSFAKKKK